MSRIKELVVVGESKTPSGELRRRVRSGTYRWHGGGLVWRGEENEDRAASEVFLVAEVRLVALCGAALVEVQLVWCGA